MVKKSTKIMFCVIGKADLKTKQNLSSKTPKILDFYKDTLNVHFIKCS